MVSGPTNAYSRVLFRGVEAAFAVWFLVGLLVVGFGLETPLRAFADFVFLLLGAAVLWGECVRRVGSGGALRLFLWVACVSGLIEFTGTHTGFPFGSYTYTDQMGPRVAGLPLAIPLAWWIVILPLHLIALRRLGGAAWSRRILRCVLVALAAVWVDLVIEPVACWLRFYWIWEDPGGYYTVPASNFVGWFLTAFAIALGLETLVRTSLDSVAAGESRSMVASLVLASVIVTFLIAVAVNGMVVPAALAVALLGGLLANRLAEVTCGLPRWSGR